MRAPRVGSLLLPVSVAILAALSILLSLRVVSLRAELEREGHSPAFQARNTQREERFRAREERIRTREESLQSREESLKRTEAAARAKLEAANAALTANGKGASAVGLPHVCPPPSPPGVVNDNANADVGVEAQANAEVEANAAAVARRAAIAHAGPSSSAEWTVQADPIWIAGPRPEEILRNPRAYDPSSSLHVASCRLSAVFFAPSPAIVSYWTHTLPSFRLFDSSNLPLQCARTSNVIESPFSPSHALPFSHFRPRPLCYWHPNRLARCDRQRVSHQNAQLDAGHNHGAATPRQARTARGYAGGH